MCKGMKGKYKGSCMSAFNFIQPSCCKARLLHGACVAAILLVVKLVRGFLPRKLMANIHNNIKYCMLLIHRPTRPGS
jgi:hypothetical protein